MNIIIKTPGFIGDTIMMLPALKLLKQEYPESKITVVCKDNCRDIFRGYDIDKIIVDNTKGSNRLKKAVNLIKSIREERYDLGVVFHNTFMDALIFKLSNIDTIIGYDKEQRKILLDFWLKIDRSKHYINHYANLINKYLKEKHTLLPPLKLYPQKQNFITKKSKPLIGFVLGTHKDTRGYPQKQSVELFSLFKNSSYKVVLLGDCNDKYNNSIYEKQLKESKVEVINTTGKTSVGEFIDIINTLDILVTIDSSSMHIAAATNTNFITIIGKSASPFEVVKPKVNFGSYLFRGEMCIKDADFIKNIKPQEIVKEIENRLKIDK